VSEPQTNNASGGDRTEGGAATGLFQSLTRAFATIVALAQTRLELLTTELQEEVQRVAGVAIWALVALMAAMIGLLLGGLTVIFVYWETHRVLAAALVTATFFTFAIVAVLLLVKKINSRPRFLDATLSELARDRDALANRTSNS
jgi:uncharacterized membrane protein YqjE